MSEGRVVRSTLLSFSLLFKIIIQYSYTSQYSVYVDYFNDMTKIYFVPILNIEIAAAPNLWSLSGVVTAPSAIANFVIHYAYIYIYIYI